MPNTSRMQMEFSAGGIVFKTEDQEINFALILNSYGEWTFPKGHIEKGEKPESAAKREVSEEIGLKDLKVMKLIDKIDYWFKLKDILYHKFVYFYLMKVTDDALLKAQTSEIKDVRWFSAKEAREKLKYKEDPLLLNKALEILGTK
jgi:8-oxo-dGTP diphosphatase